MGLMCVRSDKDMDAGANLVTKGDTMMDVAPRWIVAADTPEKMIPQAAKVLCVVDIRPESEYDRFDEVLRKECLYAYAARSYERCFRSQLKAVVPMSFSQFLFKLRQTKWKYGN